MASPDGQWHSRAGRCIPRDHTCCKGGREEDQRIATAPFESGDAKGFFILKKRKSAAELGNKMENSNLSGTDAVLMTNEKKSFWPYATPHRTECFQNR